MWGCGWLGTAQGRDQHGVEVWLRGLWGGWHATAARMGNQGTQVCLRRLGVLLREGMLREADLETATLPVLRWLME